MDDTLYPREQGLMALVQARINAYVVEAVGLEPEEARVLQRRGSQGHPSGRAARLQVPGPGHRLGRCGGVVEGSAVARVGQEPGVEHAAGDHRDAPVLAPGQQHLLAGAVEQRHPARVAEP